MRQNVIKIREMDIQTRVINIIRENLEYKGKINPGDNLTDDLGVDSFDMLMIVNNLEEEFSVQIDDDDLEGVNTVSDIVKGLGTKLTIK